MSQSKDRYYTIPTTDGRTIQLPSVTTILQVVGKPGLVPWARNAALASVREGLETATPAPVDPVLHAAWVDSLIERAIGAPENIRDEAATFGAAVHAEIQHWLIGDRLVGWEQAFRTVSNAPKDVQDVTVRFVTWLDTAGLRILVSEKMVYCINCGYAGTFDLVVEDLQRQQHLIDVKTGNALYPEMALQVAAYAHAYEAMAAASGIRSLLLVRVPRDKEVPLEVWTEKDWWPLLGDFQAAKRLWERLLKAKDFRANIQQVQPSMV